MRRKQINHKVDGVFVLLLFALLAGSLLIVLLTGAGCYQRLAARDAESYDRTTCLQYIAGKLRHGDTQGAIRVTSFPGTDISALSLAQDIDGDAYHTLIYAYDGSLRELFTAVDTPMLPEDGNEVMPCAGLHFGPRDGLLKISVQEANGEENALFLQPRSGGRHLG